MEDRKVKVLAMLATGDYNPRQVSEKLDIPYGTVLKWRKEHKDEEENRKVQEVAELSPVALQVVVDNIKNNEPEGSIVGEQAQDIVDGVDGLQKLNSSFHGICLKLITKAETILEKEDLKTAEWVQVSNAIGGLYNNIFNSNKGATINMMQNNASGEASTSKLSMFKGSMK